MHSGPDKHGNCQVQCVYCNLEWEGSGSRLEAHLGGIIDAGIGACPKAPPAIRDEIKKARIAREVDQQRKRRLKALNQSNSAFDVTDLSTDEGEQGPVPKKAKTQATVKSLFAKDAMGHVQKAIAKFFYATGTPFDRIRSPYFADMIEEVAYVMHMGPHCKFTYYGVL